MAAPWLQFWPVGPAVDPGGGRTFAAAAAAAGGPAAPLASLPQFTSVEEALGVLEAAVAALPPLVLPPAPTHPTPAPFSLLRGATANAGDPPPQPTGSSGPWPATQQHLAFGPAAMPPPPPQHARCAGGLEGPHGGQPRRPAAVASGAPGGSDAAAAGKPGWGAWGSRPVPADSMAPSAGDGATTRCGVCQGSGAPASAAPQHGVAGAAAAAVGQAGGTSRARQQAAAAAAAAATAVIGTFIASSQPAADSASLRRDARAAAEAALSAAAAAAAAASVATGVATGDCSMAGGYLSPPAPPPAAGWAAAEAAGRHDDAAGLIPSGGSTAASAAAAAAAAAADSCGPGGLPWCQLSWAANEGSCVPSTAAAAGAQRRAPTGPASPASLQRPAPAVPAAGLPTAPSSHGQREPPQQQPQQHPQQLQQQPAAAAAAATAAETTAPVAAATAAAGNSAAVAEGHQHAERQHQQQAPHTAPTPPAPPPPPQAAVATMMPPLNGGAHSVSQVECATCAANVGRRAAAPAGFFERGTGAYTCHGCCQRNLRSHGFYGPPGTRSLAEAGGRECAECGVHDAPEWRPHPKQPEHVGVYVCIACYSRLKRGAKRFQAHAHDGGVQPHAQEAVPAAAAADIACSSCAALVPHDKCSKYGFFARGTGAYTCHSCCMSNVFSHCFYGPSGTRSLADAGGRECAECGAQSQLVLKQTAKPARVGAAPAAGSSDGECCYAGGGGSGGDASSSRAMGVRQMRPDQPATGPDGSAGTQRPPPPASSVRCLWAGVAPEVSGASGGPCCSGKGVRQVDMDAEPSPQDHSQDGDGDGDSQHRPQPAGSVHGGGSNQLASRSQTPPTPSPQAQCAGQLQMASAANLAAAAGVRPSYGDTAAWTHPPIAMASPGAAAAGAWISASPDDASLAPAPTTAPLTPVPSALAPEAVTAAAAADIACSSCAALVPHDKYSRRGFFARGTGAYTCHGCCQRNLRSHGFYGPPGTRSLAEAGGRECAECGTTESAPQWLRHASCAGAYSCLACAYTRKRTLAPVRELSAQLQPQQQQQADGARNDPAGSAPRPGPPPTALPAAAVWVPASLLTRATSSGQESERVQASTTALAAAAVTAEMAADGSAGSAWDSAVAAAVAPPASATVGRSSRAAISGTSGVQQLDHPSNTLPPAEAGFLGREGVSGLQPSETQAGAAAVAAAAAGEAGAQAAAEPWVAAEELAEMEAVKLHLLTANARAASVAAAAAVAATADGAEAGSDAGAGAQAQAQMPPPASARPPELAAFGQPAATAPGPATIRCATCAEPYARNSKGPSGFFARGTGAYTCHSCCCKNRVANGFYGPPGTRSLEETGGRECAECGTEGASSWKAHPEQTGAYCCAACWIRLKCRTAKRARCAQEDEAEDGAPAAAGALGAANPSPAHGAAGVLAAAASGAGGSGAAAADPAAAGATGGCGSAAAAPRQPAAASAQAPPADAGDKPAPPNSPPAVADGAEAGSDAGAGAQAQAQMPPPASARPPEPAAFGQPAATAPGPAPDGGPATIRCATCAEPYVRQNNGPSGFFARGTGAYTCGSCCHKNRVANGFYGPPGTRSLEEAGGRECAECGMQDASGWSAHPVQTGVYCCAMCHSRMKRNTAKRACCVQEYEEEDGAPGALGAASLLVAHAAAGVLAAAASGAGGSCAAAADPAAAGATGGCGSAAAAPRQPATASAQAPPADAGDKPAPPSSLPPVRCTTCAAPYVRRPGAPSGFFARGTGAYTCGSCCAGNLKSPCGFYGPPGTRSMEEAGGRECAECGRENAPAWNIHRERTGAYCCATCHSRMKRHAAKSTRQQALQESPDPEPRRSGGVHVEQQHQQSASLAAERTWDGGAASYLHPQRQQRRAGLPCYDAAGAPGATSAATSAAAASISAPSAAGDSGAFTARRDHNRQGRDDVDSEAEMPPPPPPVHALSVSSQPQAVLATPSADGAPSQPQQQQMLPQQQQQQRRVACASCPTTAVLLAGAPSGFFARGTGAYTCRACCIQNKQTHGFYGPPGTRSLEEAGGRECAECGTEETPHWCSHPTRVGAYSCSVCSLALQRRPEV
ncbi:hypothetical protein HXX76_008815 [Chlamydomonas incerta]|uniref:GATA-type domain-containing protein n=1 Tax=Chlamydomonas incerta TaxID=51695 RepID=A0A835T6B0_CHLIN|nr:hypothetical protein HXX76_008815 [Chlamydomonas incerta]|eukprot:KAG2432470.1 hypothetical protein HXX76_008815 [Chlamydomonas incerta]